MSSTDAEFFHVKNSLPRENVKDILGPVLYIPANDTPADFNHIGHTLHHYQAAVPKIIAISTELVTSDTAKWDRSFWDICCSLVQERSLVIVRNAGTPSDTYQRYWVPTEVEQYEIQAIMRGTAHSIKHAPIGNHAPFGADDTCILSWYLSKIHLVGLLLACQKLSLRSVIAIPHRIGPFYHPIFEVSYYQRH